MSSPFSVIATIAEQRIREAQEQGVFDNLPGEGKPLVLEDESHVPEDLRMAYKVLRNAGFLPPELEERKEINSLIEMLEQGSDEGEKLRQMQKLQCLLQRAGARRQRPLALEANDPYYERIVARVQVLRRRMERNGPSEA